MTDSGKRISEEDARRLWKRAAKLQADASQLDMEKEETFPHKDGEEVLQDPSEGYSLVHVREAAQDVGIEPVFLSLALGQEAILAVEGGSEEKFIDRAASRFFSKEPEFMEVRKEYPYSPKKVWPVLERAFTDDQIGTELLEVKGGDPREGGVAVFESVFSIQRSETLEYAAATADVRRFLIRLDPLEEGEGCEVIVHIPLRRPRRIGVRVGTLVTGGGGLFGGMAGWSLGGALLGATALGTLPVAAIMGALALGGAAGGGGLLRMGHISVYRYGRRVFKRAIEKVLNCVGRDLRRAAELAPPSS